MFLLRFERRNNEGRLVTMMEKEFSYLYHRTLAAWIKDEFASAMGAGDTLTIRRIIEP